MNKYLKLFKGMVRFAFSPGLSLGRLSTIPRYSKLYLTGLQQNQRMLRGDLQALYQSLQYKNQQISLRQQIINTKTKLNERINQLKNKKEAINLESFKGYNLRESIKKYVSTGFEYLQLYYQSLKNLVEGKREVLHNDQFKFQDGETVTEKQQKLQKVLGPLLGKKTN